MFKRKAKKIIENAERFRCVATLDLRNYTPEALKNMGTYSAVGLVILPENPPEGFMEAYTGVKIAAVGTTVYADRDKKLCTINGAIILNDSNILCENALYTINGLAVCSFDEAPKNTEFVISGMLIKRRATKMNCKAVCGKTIELDFDPDKVRLFDDTVIIDKAFLNYVEKGSLIIAGNIIDFDKNVTEEDILQKELTFLSANLIQCKKNIMGVVRSRSSYREAIVKK